MTGRTHNLHSSEHAVADALLPWYVNGTLRGDELERVKQHVTGCAACRQEVAWLRDVFAACVAAAPLPEAPAVEAAVTPDPRQLGRERMWATARQSWQSTPRWIRALMAAQLAGLLILGALLAGDAGDPAYRTLGSPGRAATSGDVIAVVFDPAITEAELRSLVNGIGGRVVDGPTTTSAYLMEVPVGRSNSAVEKLRRESKVRLAEPLGEAKR